MQSTRSPKDTSVKFFTSEMAGSPSLTQAAGSLIDVLSACLVNGFGMQQASSFTVTAGVGQITVPVATGWERMCVIEVAGCTDASYNGEYKLTQVSADGLKVSFPIDAPDGAVLGAVIAVKLAGAGWVLRFSDAVTNKAVYMPGTPQWAGHCLRVEDIAGTHALVRAYESMSGVDEGLGSFPRVEDVASPTWIKAAATTRPARWMLLADERLVYLGVASGYASAVTSTAYVMRWFGRFHPLSPQDMHSITVSVQNGVAVAGSAVASGSASVSTNTVGSAIFTARSFDGASVSVAGMVSPIYFYAADSGADSACGAATGLGVGDLVFARKFLRHSQSSYPRATMPAVLHSMQTLLTSVVAENSMVNLEGRVHRLFSGPAASTGAVAGGRLCAIDAEGPWS